jgi:hypothetical protein
LILFPHKGWDFLTLVSAKLWNIVRWIKINIKPICAINTSLIPSLFIEVSVPTRKARGNVFVC